MTLVNHDRSHGQPLQIEGTVDQVMGVLALESTRIMRHGATGWRGQAKVSVGSESATFPLARGWSMRWLQTHLAHRARTLRP